MKKLISLSLIAFTTFPFFAQQTSSNPNPLNFTRQGRGGNHNGITTNVGFVNAQPLTDGTAYYFDEWDTSGTIYTKSNGNVKLEKININLYDNTLEALYEDNSIFTFNSDNLVRVVINNKVFRTFEVNGKTKIFEQIFNDGFSIYKNYSVIYSEASVNPMHVRKNNKYIKKANYYSYTDGELSKLKLSKKSFARKFQSDNHNEEDIRNFIKNSNITLSDEADLLRTLKYLSK